MNFLLLTSFSIAACFLSGLSQADSKNPVPILEEIRKDLKLRKSASFEFLTEHWKKTHGTHVIRPLLALAKEVNESDFDRYIAIMGLARIGGKEVAPWILPFLNDRAWMVRIGTLRALMFLNYSKAGSQIISMLRDPALVVRREVVIVIEKLHLKAGIQPLVQTLKDKKNFHKGRAQWVPNRALKALIELKAPANISKDLRHLLEYQQDPGLLRETVTTLDQLNGQKTSTRSLKDRVRYWKKALS